MRKALTSLPTPWLLLAVLGFGCRSQPEIVFESAPSHFEGIVAETQYPDASAAVSPHVRSSPPPRSIREPDAIEFLPIELDEAIRMALANSEVMRNVGGRVVASGADVKTIYDPAIRSTDPLFGPEAALSDFDTQFSTNVFWDRNERSFNNVILGGGRTTGFAQNRARFQAELSKRATTGTQFSLRNVTDYDRNNLPLNTFPSYHDTYLEAELRHPLLQGSGREFNQIAGPRSQPGLYNGVLIARINTDISVTEFEAAVRNLILDVEQTYWECHFAYQDFEAKKAGREAAFQTWQAVQRRLDVGRASREEEARAREEFHLYHTMVLDALGGNRLSGQYMTTTNGLYPADRRLRFLLGLPAEDHRLIRPTDEPSTAKSVFEWNACLQDALCRRAELRKQRMTVQRRELELIAARNFLRPRVDFVGQYRWRGFGDDLFGSSDVPNGSAFGDLGTGDLQEWTLGLQLERPIGNRLGHTAVRQAELKVAREKAILRDAERVVSREVSDAFAELERAYEMIRASSNRRVAAADQMDSIQKNYDAGRISLDDLLDARQRTTRAESAYHRSLIEYSRAISRLYFARGSLLDYYGVSLAESPTL